MKYICYIISMKNNMHVHVNPLIHLSSFTTLLTSILDHSQRQKLTSRNPANQFDGVSERFPYIGGIGSI